MVVLPQCGKVRMLVIEDFHLAIEAKLMLGSWDTTIEAESVLQKPTIEITSCEREMLLKGVTLYSCQSKYLALRTRKAGVGGD